MLNPLHSDRRERVSKLPTFITGKEIQQFQTAIDVLENMDETSETGFFYVPESDVRKIINNLYKEYNEDKKHQKFNSSWTRVIIITTLTYIIMSNYMLFLEVKDPYYNAVIPATGFYLSTLSLSFVRKLWIQWYERNHHAHADV
jgi:hypothetical protein